MRAESPSRPWLLAAALGWSLVVLLAGMFFTGAQTALAPLYGLADPRVGPAGLGAFVGHAILCGSDSRRRRVLRAGLLLELIRIVIVVRAGIPADSAVLSAGYGFFAAALADFIVSREWRFAALAALVPIGMTNAQFGLSSMVKRLTPLTYDGALYALDLALRVPFSSWTGELFARVPAITLSSLIAYAALPGMIAAGLAYEEYNHRRGVSRGVGVNLLLAYAVSGSLAALLYWLCPGTGPSHAFGSLFPRNLPPIEGVDLGLAPFAPESPRNAMPSLHAAWAIMLVRSTAGARRAVRYTAMIFAALTAIATIGSGEHYLIDLIAAVPFMIALEAATAHRYIGPKTRIVPLSLGVSLYLAWVLAVRGGGIAVPFLYAHPLIMWLAVVLTVALPAGVALRPVMRFDAASARVEADPRSGDTLASTVSS